MHSIDVCRTRQPAYEVLFQNKRAKLTHLGHADGTETYFVFDRTTGRRHSLAGRQEANHFLEQLLRTAPSGDI